MEKLGITKVHYYVDDYIWCFLEPVTAFYDYIKKF